MPLNDLTKKIGGLALSAGMFSVGALTTGDPLAQEHKEVTFADVLPIMKAHCTRCHAGGEQAAAKLDLESFEGTMKGGVSGKAVLVGKSPDSLLVHRLLGMDGKPQMPLGFTAISAREIGVVKAWIDGGCQSGAAARKHWAYEKPERPSVPKVGSWARNAIDAFVLRRLNKEHLRPSPEADKTTLIRRVTLDLTGLPPTPAEVDAFLKDTSPNAYEKVVDRLFASPHYGERMALPWLDAARYADSNGFQYDGDTYQYVWRDWVVRAMNANMPFNEFTTLQIAGDLLPGSTVATPEGRDAIVATAFNRNHMLNGEGGAIPEEARSVALFDRVDTTSTTWLGVTMTCARCHDHKYDPLTQQDYYSLMAFFNNVPETGIPEGGVPYSIAKPWIYAGSQQQMNRLFQLQNLVRNAAAANRAMEGQAENKELVNRFIEKPTVAPPKPIADILKIEPGKRNPEQNGQVREFALDHALPGEAAKVRKRYLSLQRELSGLQENLPKVMVMTDRKPRQTHIFSRGNYDQPLDKVGPSTPAILPKMASNQPKNRLGLAEWLTSPENPLTARVQVNRYWQLFFGRGLVKTPENFGVQGDPPSHPELLDWLAVQFEESGWDVKGIQRLIVTSATYRQSSKSTKALAKLDPDNRLLARGSRFRLPAMLLRDEALAASGLLDRRIGGKPVYPYQPKGIWDGLDITDERDFSYPQSKGRDLYRRSLYSFWRRTAAPANMFDSASRQVCTVRQSLTSTPLHALTMLNDVTWVEAGRALAQRVMLSEPFLPERRLQVVRKGVRPMIGMPPPATGGGPSRVAAAKSEAPFTLSSPNSIPGASTRGGRRHVSPKLHVLTHPPHSASRTPVLSSDRKAKSALESRLTEAFKLVCARKPEPSELAILVRSYNRALSAFQNDSKAAADYLAQGEFKPDARLDKVELAAYASVCLAILNLDEALTRE